MATPTQEQIDDAKNRVMDLLDEGKNPWPGMTYLEGVRDTLDWLEGLGDSPVADAD